MYFFRKLGNISANKIFAVASKLEIDVNEKKGTDYHNHRRFVRGKRAGYAPIEAA